MDEKSQRLIYLRQLNKPNSIRENESYSDINKEIKNWKKKQTECLLL